MKRRDIYTLLCNLLLIVQLLNRPAAALRPNDNVALLSKSLKDRLNLNEDGITHVDPNEQDAILEIVAKNCTDRILNSTYNPVNCPIEWDTIICWPETPVNKTVYLDCPKYVDNFKIYNKASKTCTINQSTSQPEWTKTDLRPCLMIPVIEADDEMESLERHMTNIIILRICGYFVSMVSLTLSIIILLRPKLRCPRNYVHVNLFLAFVIRTILVMLVDVILHNKASAVFQINPINTDKTNSSDLMQTQYIPCQVMISLFRYSGSVYHVAIFSEALYLVLLLRFPYYNEKKGSKVCIIAAWLVPFLWIIPWVIVKQFVDNKWCWQMESDWNLIIKIPHSLLLVVNIASAVFIIKVLYSKMRNRLTKEKIIKYRRLAKSILILIPIFGLHFIVFAWLPYASIINLNQTFEIISSYVETFFNAFQGVVVSIVCCFIHREVRIECLLFACELLKKIRCLQSLSCMKCLDSDYIRQLRYAYNENRAGSLVSARVNGVQRSSTNESALVGIRIYNDVLEPLPPAPKRKSKQSKLKSVCKCTKDQRDSVDLGNELETNPMLLAAAVPQRPSKIRTYSNNDSIADVSINASSSSSSNKRKSSMSMSLVSSGPTGIQQLFGCLFGSKRNDFHQRETGVRKTLRSMSSNEDKKVHQKGSGKHGIDEEPDEDAHGAKNPLIKLFKFDESNRSESLTSNGKKKVRLLLDVDGPNGESGRLNSHHESGSNEYMDGAGMSDDEETRGKLSSGQKKSTKSLTNSELSSIDCQLNNTATESTNCTTTNLTGSSNNLSSGPVTCLRCQKRRVSSISNNFYNLDGSAQTDDNSPSKYCKCRLDLFMSEAAGGAKDPSGPPAFESNRP